MARGCFQPGTELVMPKNYPGGCLVGCVTVCKWLSRPACCELLHRKGHGGLGAQLEKLPDASVVLCGTPRKLVVPFALDMSKVVGDRGLKAEGHKGLWLLQKPTLKRAESGLVDGASLETSLLPGSWSEIILGEGSGGCVHGESVGIIDPVAGMKRLRKLQKTLKQISQLEKKAQGGEALEATQQAKLDTKGGIMREVAMLEAALGESSS